MENQVSHWTAYQNVKTTMMARVWQPQGGCDYRIRILMFKPQRLVLQRRLSRLIRTARVRLPVRSTCGKTNSHCVNARDALKAYQLGGS